MSAPISCVDKSRCWAPGPSRQGQAECAKFIADHNIAVEKLFTHRWPLDQAKEAYRLFDTQTTGKGVILPS
jgi:threonine dehydrogenase-like Zn-dependent dehydrogenase